MGRWIGRRALVCVCVLLATFTLGCPRDPVEPRPSPLPELDAGGASSDVSVIAEDVRAASADALDDGARAARIARAKSYQKPPGPPGKRFYLPHYGIPATIFWVGEPATKQNGCTANLASAFDHDWKGAYGGCDSATGRVVEGDGFHRPSGFVPKQNPYYFALPYGSNPDAPYRDEVPWVDDRPGAEDIRSAVKNRWIAVRRKERTCYAQWEDVGPFCADDAEYVFGYSAPRNDGKTCDVPGPGNGTISGLDVSPALSACLGVKLAEGLFDVDWWFVDDAHVPPGPWMRVVTTSPVRDGPPRPSAACVEKPPYPACG